MTALRNPERDPLTVDLRRIGTHIVKISPKTGFSCPLKKLNLVNTGHHSFKGKRLAFPEPLLPDEVADGRRKVPADQIWSR